MVIVPIVVSSKVCSVCKQSARARGRDGQGLFKSSTNSLQVRLLCLHPPGLELVSKELNHLAAILHVYAGGLNFMQ